MPSGATRAGGSSRDYFAPCTLGLEEVLAQEVRELGGSDVAPRRGGAAFRGDRRLAYAANLWLRSAVRVQEKVAEFEARGKEELYAAAREVEWERWLDVDGTLAVDASVRDSAITHSGFAALTVKDAICDRFRARTGRRPSVDVEMPALPIKLHLHRDHGRLYLDLSGVSLHKRGWRPIQARAPLNEAIAAGLILLSGWDRRSPIVDPMCGSGTFLVEAASLAADRAPGLKRRFAFEGFPDFDPALWDELKLDAAKRAKFSLPFPIEGADRHEGALAIAQRSVRAAELEGLVRLTRSEVAEFVPSFLSESASGGAAAESRTDGPTPRSFTVLVNPPWGEEVFRSWRDLGRFLHERCRGATAFVLSGHSDLPRHLGLKASRKWNVATGPIECRWLRYEIGPQAGREAAGSP
jgi:putative N6-adenine-specific DNA methylase